MIVSYAGSQLMSYWADGYQACTVMPKSANNLR